MKTYSVSLWADIIVDAENEEQATANAYKELERPSARADFFDRLEVEENGVDEITDTGDFDEQVPESISDDGSIACMYDHDHSRGGCEWHD